MARTEYVCPTCEIAQRPSGRRPGWCPVCEENRYFELIDDDGVGAGRSSPPTW